MADSARIYKVRGCKIPLAGSDPPDVETSGAGWSPAPRQNILKISAECVIAPSTESRQPQNLDRDNIVQIRAIDLQTCTIAIACDDLNRIPLKDATRADIVARGFRMQPHDGALILRTFNTRIAALRECLARYEDAR